MKSRLPPGGCYGTDSPLEIPTCPSDCRAYAPNETKEETPRRFSESPSVCGSSSPHGPAPKTPPTRRGLGHEVKGEHVGDSHRQELQQHACQVTPVRGTRAADAAAADPSPRRAASGAWGHPPLDLRHGHLLKLLELVLCVEPVTDATVLPAGPARPLPRLGLGHALHGENLQAAVWGVGGRTARVSALPHTGTYGFHSVDEKQHSSEHQRAFLQHVSPGTSRPHGKAPKQSAPHPNSGDVSRERQKAHGLTAAGRAETTGPQPRQSAQDRGFPRLRGFSVPKPHLQETRAAGHQSMPRK